MLLLYYVRGPAPAAALLATISERVRDRIPTGSALSGRSSDFGKWQLHGRHAQFLVTNHQNLHGSSTPRGK